MASNGRHESPASEVWAQFRENHEGHRHFSHDPLYSLTLPLIDRLEAEAPGLLGSDLAFERDLAAATEGGLVDRGRVLPCPLRIDPASEGQKHAEAQIRAAEADLLTMLGDSPARLAPPDEEQIKHDDQAHRRLKAYAGWLVLNQAFLDERDHLRKWGDSTVEERGGFPSLPRSYLGESALAADKDEAHFHLFYRRWNLSSFVTWDLPLPLLPEVGVTTLDQFTLSGAGVTIFLPWYVAQDGLFSLDELAGHLKSVYRSPHLENWLSIPSGGGKCLGDTRLAYYFTMYRYRDLVLNRRYGDRLKGRTNQLDRAFSSFLGCASEDTIKKIRTSVARLKNLEASEPEVD